MHDKAKLQLNCAEHRIGQALRAVEALANNHARKPDQFLALNETEDSLLKAETKIHEARKTFEQEII